MNFIKYILLFVLQFFLITVCFAQKEKYRAVLWGTDEGLSWAGGNFMIKDKNGFLWISSVFGGLNRFDGNAFKKYPEEGSDRGNIASVYTAYGLIEDSLHNIWIGTNEGISRYDINADTFTNFKITP